MRLLRVGDCDELSLVEHIGRHTPPYAILSHTWGADGDEVTFGDIVDGGGKSKPGYRKLSFCAKQAASDGLKLFWVDTCCIDKSSSAELQEAINSMYQWYQKADRCYVYLSDVSTSGSAGSDSSPQQAWKQAFQDSRWFTRGWTLQELLAPTSVEFFSAEGERLGSKVSLLQEVHATTGIASQALQGTPLHRFSVETRLSWAYRRNTTREEDKAYALLGIFEVHLSLIYGEGEKNAFRRLREEIQRSSRYAAEEQASIQSYHAQPDIVSGVERVLEAPWVVTLPRPPSFVGRETELARLHAHVSSTTSQRLAIYGLGGCGKTALALETAYRVREHQPTCAVFWVPAVSRESFEQSYRDIAIALNVPGIAGANANVKRLVKARLSNENIGSWLMVIDNADDVSVLFDPLDTGGSEERLIDFVPHSRKGSVLFTTRNRKAAVDLASGTALQLGELDEREAKELLRARLLPENHVLLDDKEIVHEFLDMLAFLALAIVQAAAFINKNNSTLDDYLSMYKDSEEDAIELLSKDFEDRGRYRDTKNPVATTWYISFKQMQRENQLTADYLSFMSCTAGEGIPASLLLPGNRKMATMEAIGTLTSYAFVTERQQRGKEGRNGERTYDIHRLVCLASQNWLRDHKQWNAWVQKTLYRMVEVVPYGGHERREVWTAYLPHAIHVVSLSGVCETESRMSLLDRIGRCEHSLGRYKSAEAAHQQVLRQREATLGKEHPHTLTSMSNVAQALSNQGKYAEAEKMHGEVLALREKVSGKEHPDTLTCMNNVAQALSKQGKYAEAEKMHGEVLALREKVSGKEHPDTLTCMSNVAQALSKQGKYAEAEKMHRETLALREKVSGKEHPHTLTSMSNVTQALSKQGKYAEAEKMHRETLALREKVSGKNIQTR
ncbi:HET-domain-containing protein [Polyplosphaeria fusca]|uniref:HET-domain-containing protein n=1 Tax=Polyplosphaeria fusca TaxID=682080 RepID=A0A9P4V181_9PLEO|nr:HET-domain-containing protein [Polyplosphaeria fusca]